MLSGVFSVCRVWLVMAVESQEAVDNDNHVHGTLYVGILVSVVSTAVSRMKTGAGEACRTRGVQGKTGIC